MNCSKRSRELYCDTRYFYFFSFLTFLVSCSGPHSIFCDTSRELYCDNRYFYFFSFLPFLVSCWTPQHLLWHLPWFFVPTIPALNKTYWGEQWLPQNKDDSGSSETHDMHHISTDYGRAASKGRHYGLGCFSKLCFHWIYKFQKVQTRFSV